MSKDWDFVERETYEGICAATGVETAVVGEMSLAKIQPFRNAGTSVRTVPWLERFTSARFVITNKYCSLCLSGSGYFKRAWRFNFVTACEIHRVLLRRLDGLHLKQMEADRLNVEMRNGIVAFAASPRRSPSILSRAAQVQPSALHLQSWLVGLLEPKAASCSGMDCDMLFRGIRVLQDLLSNVNADLLMAAVQGRSTRTLIQSIVNLFSRSEALLKRRSTIPTWLTHVAIGLIGVVAIEAAKEFELICVELGKSHVQTKNLDFSREACNETRRKLKKQQSVIRQFLSLLLKTAPGNVQCVA